MNVEKIQEMWETDSVIDPDNLHDASIEIPKLHSKYYNLYNTVTLLKSNAKQQYNRVHLDRYNFYTGKADPEVYEEEPFPYKVRDKDSLDRHLKADKRLSDIELKIQYYDVMLKFLEDILKTIQNRTFQIKNAIEWQKFQAGFS